MEYLNENEEVKLQIKTLDEEELILTEKRVIRYTKRKNLITYKDVPIDKISYIEHEWKEKNKVLIIIGIIMIICSVVFFSLFVLYPVKIDTFYTTVYIFNMFYPLIGIPLLIIGVVLLLKGLKQGGFILINDKSWRFNFKTEKSKKFIKEFIQLIYFLT